MIEILQFVATSAGTQPAGSAAGDAGDPATVDFSQLLGAGMDRIAEPAAPGLLLPADAQQTADSAPERTDSSSDPETILNAIAASQLPADPGQIAALPVPPASQLPILPAVMAASSGSTRTAAEAPAKAARNGTQISPFADDRRGSPQSARAGAAPEAFDFTSAALRQAAMPQHGADGELRADVSAKAVPESQSATHLLLSHQTQHAVREPIAAHVESVPQQVGTPAWNEGFAGRVVWMAKNDIQTAELRLNPADLGPIDVTLTLSGDDKTQATVQFSAANAGTREAIETALPRLREMLQESGISLGQAGVDANNSNAGDTGRHQSGGNQRGRFAGQSETGTTTVAVPAGSRSLGRGLVDTFA